MAVIAPLLDHPSWRMFSVWAHQQKGEEGAGWPPPYPGDLPGAGGESEKSNRGRLRYSLKVEAQAQQVCLQKA